MFGQSECIVMFLGRENYELICGLGEQAKNSVKVTGTGVCCLVNLLAWAGGGTED